MFPALPLPHLLLPSDLLCILERDLLANSDASLHLDMQRVDPVCKH